MNEVVAALENPTVWNEPKRAQELGKEKKLLETVVGTIDHLAGNLADNTELFEMSKAEGDDDALITVIAETLIHELGHFFGMSEDEIMAIEDHYWRGDAWPDDDAPDGSEGSR